MKKYINILLTTVVLGFVAVFTADAQSNRDFRPDFDYYDEEFDWRWDVRVRISDGINSGLITRWEANRLYRKLENIEEKEYAYLADGFYEPWEQDEIWRDVQWLNSRVGLELRDFDRTYYGFTPIGIAFTGYPSWWYGGGYNFYRFDRWGWGSIRRGYTARCFVPLWVPNRVVYVNNFRNYGHRYYRNDSRRNNVVRYEGRTSDRNVTRSPRTSGRSGTVYNRDSNTARRGTAVTPNSRSRSSSANRSVTPNRSTSRTRTYNGRSESLNRSGSVNTRSRETNRPTTSRSSNATSRSSREISRPSTSSSRSVAPSRSSTSRSESFNRSSRSSSSRSSVNRSTSRPSSSRSSSVSRSSSSRTKVPEARRSTSSRSRSSSSATRKSPREN